MFEIDRQRTSLSLPPDRVLTLVSSLNSPLVVADDMPIEPTRAYICAYTEGGDRCAFSIYLHCMESNKGVFYRHEEHALPRGRFDEVMAEAMAFAESLGFMMDDLRWRDLDAARKSELLEESPLFHEPKPAVASVGAVSPVAEPSPPPVPPLPAAEAPPAPVPPPARPAPSPPPAVPTVTVPPPAVPTVTVGATEVELEIDVPVPEPAPAPRAAEPAPVATVVPAAQPASAAHDASPAAHASSHAAAPVTVDALPSRVAGAPQPAAPSGGGLAAAAQVVVRLLASL